VPLCVSHTLLRGGVCAPLYPCLGGTPPLDGSRLLWCLPPLPPLFLCFGSASYTHSFPPSLPPRGVGVLPEFWAPLSTLGARSPSSPLGEFASPRGPPVVLESPLPGWPPAPPRSGAPKGLGPPRKTHPGAKAPKGGNPKKGFNTPGARSLGPKAGPNGPKNPQGWNKDPVPNCPGIPPQGSPSLGPPKFPQYPLPVRCFPGKGPRPFGTATLGGKWTPGAAFPGLPSTWFTTPASPSGQCAGPALPSTVPPGFGHPKKATGSHPGITRASPRMPGWPDNGPPLGIWAGQVQLMGELAQGPAPGDIHRHIRARSLEIGQDLFFHGRRGQPGQGKEPLALAGVEQNPTSGGVLLLCPMA